MRSLRLPHLAAAAGLLLTLSAPIAFAGPAVVDAGKAWSMPTADGLQTAPAPDGVTLHRAASLGDGILMTGVSDSRIVLLRARSGSFDQLEELPAPKIQYDRVVSAPTPLVADGLLRQLLWIEGSTSRQTRVQSAQWSGSGWSQPTTVSDFGPGTQIALDAVRLTDGSLLAVWARFDGDDDEIVWSRFADGVWSTPEPISDNAVPDVTPALLATPEGAVVAWSGYDGQDYRVHLARFRAGTWSRWLTLGDQASTWPAFHVSDDVLSGGGEPVLTWRQPGLWRVAQLDAEGGVRWISATQRAGVTADRPLVVPTDSDALSLHWPSLPPEQGPAAKDRSRRQAHDHSVLVSPTADDR